LIAPNFPTRCLRWQSTIPTSASPSIARPQARYSALSTKRSLRSHSMRFEQRAFRPAVRGSGEPFAMGAGGGRATVFQHCLAGFRATWNAEQAGVALVVCVPHLPTKAMAHM
jgi:2-hydroxychromene-2-carboxylate isomerase